VVRSSRPGNSRAGAVCDSYTSSRWPPGPRRRPRAGSELAAAPVQRQRRGGAGTWEAGPALAARGARSAIGAARAATSKKDHALEGEPRSASIRSSASAWATVRGNPSGTNPGRRRAGRAARRPGRSRRCRGRARQIHVALGPRPRRRRQTPLAEHVPGRDLRDAPLAGQLPRLGALARPRRAQEDHADAHARAFAFLRRKPS
jgi:hypothetical protein